MNPARREQKETKGLDFPDQQESQDQWESKALRERAELELMDRKGHQGLEDILAFAARMALLALWELANSAHQ